MATYNGINKTLALTPTGQNLLGSGLFGGKLRVMIDTYLMTTGDDEVTGQTVAMGSPLPTGAKVVEVLLHSEVLSSGAVAVSIGDAQTSTRYMSSVACGTGAAQTSQMANAAVAGRGYKIQMTAAYIAANTPDNQILLTFTSVAATVIAGTKIILMVFYTVE